MPKIKHYTHIVQVQNYDEDMIKYSRSSIDGNMSAYIRRAMHAVHYDVTHGWKLWHFADHNSLLLDVRENRRLGNKLRVKTCIGLTDDDFTKLCYLCKFFNDTKSGVLRYCMWYYYNFETEEEFEA